ncbi:hypothetical protein C7H19_11800 [Aphanothece hegewaldii CCALA 016]|uniref:Uncharacterized protein n=1 Tax=Aphanothece hegewaldii CCALA 016 TaxID=2107694 RepID=A0A2T1LXK1_9CHRO|nr:antibiotic biosynthesis monooxygenase [Aphanothece hegewaldii]PSF37115.1 hypothetical protein C7H19_11800 [Aphanothece hegewaldii CCALA 016]
MITLSKTFILDSGKKDSRFEKLRKLYTEILPLQVGYISSNLILNEQETEVTAIANWEDEEKLVAVQDLDSFKELQIG